ncbi:hypothetical protein QI155_06100 [Thermodesulfovibrio sp. 1176]|uniref:hypothetical protein n=1 Tax=Thermodesulfovibrio sp. 1176 TaxID=3043424 RepID=UPI002482BDAF|nr:hypothetical protein [Thermodesulfovibrio sp. 1176]MDI1472107.1 hypothetical protein [Thermodesulfovibrio sp. 1176]
MSNEIFTVRYGGIQLKGDILITDRHGKLILLSCYGSESHIKGIFANLGQGYDVEIITSKEKLEASRYWSQIRLKLIKIGYGKYHGVIYNQKINEYLIIFPGETLEEAYSRFFEKRRVPILNKWISEFHRLAITEKLLAPLNCIGIQAYDIYVSDDSICDFIVKNIKTLKNSCLQKAINQ